MSAKDGRLRWPILLIFLGALFVYFVFLKHGSIFGKKDIRYGLMFDGGSTGSRVHVFSFDAHSGKLLDEIFQEVKPGLSSYADPKAAARSLAPLMKTSVEAIPAVQHASTPIALKATAGLRQLGPEKAEEILQAIRDYWASEFNFKMGQDAVQIMEGSDEGVYAWITVNYLLNRLGNERKPTVSVMDLGGASTQIVFEPKGEAMKAAPKEYVYNLQFGKYNYMLYQHSYDRYGLMRAREKILTKMAEKHVCIPKGYTFKAKIEGKDLSFGHHDQTSYTSCYNTVRSIIDKSIKCEHDPCSFAGAFHPDISNAIVFNDDMYAFSYFFDRTQLDGEKPVVTLGEIRDMAQKSCALEAPDEAHGTQCMDLTYIYALLHDGYNLKDEHKLNIAKKINGIETAWALGAMVVQMAAMDLQTTSTA
jgi:guanosine-diphosphatase